VALLFEGTLRGLFGVMERMVAAPLSLRPPAEWLWRSLTYGRWQPLRHT
jgi:hypothetical protein